MRRPLRAAAVTLALGFAVAACAGLGVRAPAADPSAAGPAESRPAAEPGQPTTAANGASPSPAPNPPTDEVAIDETGSDKDEIDDGAETPGPPIQGQIYKHPLDGWNKGQIEAELVLNPAALGSMSIGFTNAGALYNGVQMPEGDAWEVVDPDHAWGTGETIDYLSRCIRRVAEQFPTTPKMFIGHISGPRGGHLSPHVSHQAGRDVDVSYYYTADQTRWYLRANASNLDRARTWSFLKALVTDTDVELVLMDRGVQTLVRQYAVEHGEDRAWVDQLFDGTAALPPLVRHAKGHATHIHVRFYNPIAQETGRRAYEVLLRRRIIQPPSYFVRHKVREGETLGHLAKKYRVPAKAIQQANGLKSSLIRASHDYKIPQRGGVKACPRALIPMRRTPPGQSTG